MNNLAQSHRPLAKLLATGQTTQYSSEPDDGYFEKGIVKSYTILTTGAQSGNAVIELIHLDANTGVSFVAATKEIDCAGAMGVFKAAGGETIVITGSTSNNGTFTTKATGDANKILVNETIVNEAAGASVVIKKQETITNGNNVVIDNNTGLMWARNTSSKMGVAGEGNMPWTGVPYDIFAFCSAANAASLGGYSDWRIPNMTELASLPVNETIDNNPSTIAFSSGIGVLTSSAYANPSTPVAKALRFSRYGNGFFSSNWTSALPVTLVRG